MSTDKTITIEATLGDNFKVESKIGGRTLAEAKGVDADRPTPMQYFYISFANCIAAIADTVAAQSDIPDCSLNLTITGDLSDLEPTAVEIAVKMDADLSFEEKKSFLEEVDASLRSISHLTKNKLEQ